MTLCQRLAVPVVLADRQMARSMRAVVEAAAVLSTQQVGLAVPAAAVLGLTETHQQPWLDRRTQDQVVVVVVVQQKRRQLARLAALE